ncbi:MAG TPA: zinc ribbon domain-containing protein [Blastocatellia bacterium]|nr:zinc ribbon domain-containing protein [Blastocatellia bacterium]
MYCPSCGTEGTDGQSYCKRCGASLSAAPQIAAPKNPLPKLAGMFWAVAVFGLGSIATLLGCLVALAAIGVNSEAIAMTGIFGGVTIFGIAGLLIWQLSRLINVAQNTDAAAQPRKLKTAPQAAYPQIAGPHRAVPSITEHTTRNFEPSVRDERTSREYPHGGGRCDVLSSLWS